MDGFHALTTTMLMVISMSDATKTNKEEPFAETPVTMLLIEKLWDKDSAESLEDK
jgi:hypothetical protein